jgi:exosortase
MGNFFTTAKTSARQPAAAVSRRATKLFCNEFEFLSFAGGGLIRLWNGPNMDSLDRNLLTQNEMQPACTTAEPIPRQIWPLGGFVIAGALGAAIYWTTAIDLFQDWWNEPSLSQGLLIPPLALYFAWADRKRLMEIPAEPTALGLFGAASSSLLYVLGKLGAEFFLQRISMVAMFASFLWLCWGSARLKRLAFPLVLLTAMIPLPAIVYNTITAPLQLFASNVASLLARLGGVSLYRDGNVIQLAHLSLGVDEACSGLSSFSALVIAALLIGRLLCEQSLAARILLVLFSAPLSIALNVLRIAGTAVLADYREEFALGFYHLFAGWLVFLLGFAGLFLMAGAARRIEQKE